MPRQVVFIGIHLVIPLISPELLKFPKLCRQYFSLLAVMFDVYPDKVAALAAEPFQQVMNTLHFGLTQGDATAGSVSLEALAAVAKFHFLELKAGKPGLGAHRYVIVMACPYRDEGAPLPFSPEPPRPIAPV